MKNEKIYSMQFQKVYFCLVNKALRKNKTKDEVNQIISWLTGYSSEQILNLANSSISYAEFFEKAPHLNENRSLIKGTVCKIKVQDIQEPLMQNIRYLDLMIDELAKGKDMSKILRKQ